MYGCKVLYCITYCGMTTLMWKCYNRVLREQPFTTELLRLV